MRSRTPRNVWELLVNLPGGDIRPNVISTNVMPLCGGSPGLTPGFRQVFSWCRRYADGSAVSTSAHRYGLITVCNARQMRVP